MSIWKVRKNDTVIAITGVSAGKTGNVLHVFPGRGRAIVEGFNVVKKTMRKSQENPKGGISEKEAPVNLSNLMLYCPDCKKGVKVRRDKEGDKNVRKCKRCGHSFNG